MAEKFDALPREKTAGEDLHFAVELSARLDEGESLTGTPEVTATPAGLTLGAPTLSGTQILVQISGGTAGTRYTVLGGCETTTQPWREAKCPLDVF